MQKTIYDCLRIENKNTLKQSKKQPSKYTIIKNITQKQEKGINFETPNFHLHPPKPQNSQSTTQHVTTR